MGIPRFYNGWVSRLPYSANVVRKVHRVQPGMPPRAAESNEEFLRVLNRGERVGWVHLDMNGIFHSAAQDVYSYGKGESAERSAIVAATPASELERQHIVKITDSIEQILRITSPKYGLVMCVDGVALPAKMNQQRSRRFLAGQRSGPDAPPPKIDSNSITPGTEFMFRLDAHIRKWIASSNGLPPRVYYSGHTQPGEGEHKIMDILRGSNAEQTRAIHEDITKTLIDKKAVHVIYGLDADLFMLSLLSPVTARGTPVYLMREETGEVASIQALAGYILARIYGSENKVWASDTTGKLAIHTFVALMFLIGNDFLPHGPMFHDISKNIEDLLSAASRVGPVVSGTDALTIRTDRLQKVVDILASEETSALYHQSFEEMNPKRPMTNPNTLFKRSFALTDLPLEERRDIYENLWATKVTTLRPESNYRDDELKRCARAYLYGMQWTMLYYGRGGFSGDETFIYPSLYAPTMRTLSTVLNSEGASTMKQKNAPPSRHAFTIYRQLLTVLPTSSAALMPPQLQPLSASGSPLSDMYPSSVKVDLDGTFQDYQGVALVPPANITRIESALDALLLKHPELVDTKYTRREPPILKRRK